MVSERFRIAIHAKSVLREDGVVILDVNAGKYYSLNPVGVAVWTGLELGRTREELISDLLEKFSVPEEKLRTDVDGFLSHLLEICLIEKASAANIG